MANRRRGVIEGPARACHPIRGALAALAALVLFLLVAAPAAATIVFEREGEIWRMNDNGSGQKLLVSQDEITDIDASFLGDPHVQANGDQVVFSATKRGGGHFDATGVYRWRGGALTRLSPSPTPCSPDCSSGDVEPEIGAGGRYFFGFESWQGSSVTTQIWSANLADGGDVDRWFAWCDRDWDDAPLLGDPESPSPSPVDPGVVLYSGCSDPFGEPDHCAEGGTSVLVIDYGDEGEFICAQPDTFETELDDPSWRPDGKAFAWAQVDDGSPRPSAGLWVRELSGTQGRRVLRLPGASWNNAPRPRYAGPNSLVFAYDHDRVVGDDAEPDLYRLDGISACNPCTLADATRLTTDGTSTGPAWTAMNVEPPPVDTTPVDTTPVETTPVETTPPVGTTPPGDDSAGDPADSAACEKAKKAVKKAKKAVKEAKKAVKEAETKLEKQKAEKKLKKAKQKLKKAKQKKKRACS